MNKHQSHCFKLLTTILWCVVCIIPNSTLWGQVTYTFTGTGNANAWNRNQYPIMLGNTCSRTTQLYTKSKLNGGGIPSSGVIELARIAWHPDLTRTIQGSLTIYIKHTSLSAIDQNAWDLTNAVTVFSGNVNHTTTQGVWWEIPFSTSFFWNNVDNVQVLVEFVRTNTEFTGNIWRGYDGNEPQITTAFNVGTNCPTTLNATFSPNMKFYDTRFTTGGTAPMVLGSISATQQTGTVTRGSLQQGILRIDLPTTGSSGTLTLNSLTLTALNTSNADIAPNGVKLWVGQTLATAVQLGSSQNINSTVVFSNLAYNLTGALTQLWVTYDIASGATLGNFVDAQIPQAGINITAAGGATASGTLPATTLNPSGNRKIDYCDQLYTNDCLLYGIESVSIGTNGSILNHTFSGCTGGLGFADFTSFNINMASGQTYPFSITNTNGFSFSSGGLGIWIDFNSNGSYGDANEFVGSAFGAPYNGATSDIPYTGNIVLPAVLPGSYRMRIKLTGNVPQSLGSSCTPDNSGETHDYLVQISSTAGCVAPTTQASNLSFSNIAQTTAAVNWTNGNGAGRVVYINTTNSFTPPANGANPTANTAYAGGQQCIFNGTGSGPVNITGLTASTQYFVRVYEYCSPDRNYNTATAVLNSNNFITLANVGPQLIVTPDTLTGFSYLVGTGPSLVQSYSLSGNNLTGGGGISVTASPNFEISFNGGAFSQNALIPYGGGVITGQPVSLFVRLKAGLPVGIYANEIQAHVGGGANVSLVCEGEVTSTSGIEDGQTTIGLYPNPMKKDAILQVPSEGSYQVIWRELSGREVRRENLSAIGHPSILHVSRKTLSAGFYILNIHWADKIELLKVVISD